MASNSVQRLQAGCTSVTDDTYIQTDRPRYGNICRSRRNRFQRCRIKITINFEKIDELLIINQFILIVIILVGFVSVSLCVFLSQSDIYMVDQKTAE